MSHIHNMLVSPIVLIVLACLLHAATGLQVAKRKAHDPRYIVVCDAGSSGTRSWLFYLNALQGVEEVVDVHALNVNPGLSTFGEKPEMAGIYLEPVISSALELVPPHSRKNTYVFVLATAGMRSLTETAQTAVYDAVYDYFTRNDNGIRTIGDSILHRDFLVTITGREEGFFGMLAVNYLKGRIGPIGGFPPTALGVRVVPSNPPHWPVFPLRNSVSEDSEAPNEPACGALDLGGMSTQILYDPLPPEDSLYSPQKIYAHSFLGMGAAAFRKRMNSVVISKTNYGTVGKSPCYNKGKTVVHQPETGALREIEGTGDGARCRDEIRDIMKGLTPPDCTDCTFDGERMPPLQGELVAMSAFFYVTDCIRALLTSFKTNTHMFQVLLTSETEGQAVREIVSNLEARWPTPSLSELRQAADLFCSFPWGLVEENLFGGVHPATPDEKLSLRCYEVNYIIELLSFGYGIGENDRKVQFSNKIEGRTVEWPLGAFLVVNSMILAADVSDTAALRGNTKVMNALVEEHHSGGSIGWWWYMISFLALGAACYRYGKNPAKSVVLPLFSSAKKHQYSKV